MKNWALGIIFLGLIIMPSCISKTTVFDQLELDTTALLQQANEYLEQAPVPLTDFRAERS